MSGWLRLSLRIYGVILLLYPSGLRRDFGPEMSELFGEDLADSWRSGGFVAVTGVWWCALCEALRIAIPAQRTTPAIVVPALAFAVNAVMVSAEMMLPRTHALVRDIGEPVVWSGIVVALTAVAVVHTGKVELVSVRVDVAG
jgi:hypothetical protein